MTWLFAGFEGVLLGRFFFNLSIFGIIDLGENSRQIFGSTGFICKILRNNDLAPQIALKMALGQLRGSYGSDIPQSCPNQIINRRARWALSQFISFTGPGG